MKLPVLLALSCLILSPRVFSQSPPPAVATPAAASEAIQDLAIGAPAPEFSLPGIDGKTHTLADYKEAKVLMIAFLSNHCPDSHASEGRIKALLAEFKEKGFDLVAINPNNPDGLTPDELGYSKYNDGFEDMKKYAAEAGFSFPYLYDGETQTAAKAYGCLATPHVFVFDAERKLRYKGQFDDSRYSDPATVKSPDARNAVMALLANEPVPVAVTKPHGCSTKWLSKKQKVLEAAQKWDATPVDVEPIDKDGVIALRKNGTKKLRLINLWATWCAPCILEFPELVKIARKFDMRQFEFISISADDPKNPALVKGFLEKRGAGLSSRLKASVKAEGRTTNSYIYSGANLEDLLDAVDPKAQGSLPFTALVNQEGEVIWRHDGLIDGDELREKILQVMGEVYKP